MAEVYKAYQTGLDRYVAIKVMLGHMVDDPDFVSRFEREALNVGKLRHSNIVQAIDFAHEQNVYYMVMEFIDGPTLKAEMKARKQANKPFTIEEITRIITALGNAIDYAHSRHMIHRDIKPANVMINQEGQIVLTDFGIVRTMGATQHTATGALTGTPAYMSPEQGRGDRVDNRSDIYALGVILYELVTGNVPYDADTPFAVIMKHVNQPLPMPRKTNPNISEDVEKVILKTMSKNPDDRYQTAGEMARALREAAGVSFGELNKPLEALATGPKTQDIEHKTGPLSAQERMATVAAADGEATMLSPEEKTIASPSGSTVSKGQGMPMTLIAIGGGVIVVLLIAAIAFFSGLGSGGEAEATAAAGASATSAALIAAETATAEAVANVPTDTPTPIPATNTPTPIPPGTPRAVALADLEVHSGPGDDYPLLGYLPGGATVEITSRDRSGEWWQVKTSLSSGEGWIRAGDEFSAATDTVSVPIALAPPTVTPFFADTTEPPTPSPEPAATDTPEPEVTNTPSPPAETLAPPTATTEPTPDAPDVAVAGKLAFPVDNGAGKYDVFIVSLPDGNRIGKIDGAHQPNFRLDGQKLLVNGEGGSFGENVFEVSSTGNIERPVSGSPSDLHPFYKFDGTTLTYGNPQLAFGSEGYQPYIFVQCALVPPSQDSGDCADIAGFGVLVPAGQVGNIFGTHPVWTGSDQIAFKGCDTWGRGGGGSCGIYIVGSWATKRASNGENPRKLADGGSLIPTDAKAGLIAFHSRESGDWEAYVISEGGGAPVSLSNSPNSSDGLPTLSLDGKSAIFASDRSGGWAVYLVSTSGGAATKLFDFPKANPWATGDRDWTNERMSWAP
jgi:uncharacterized protein YraI